MNKRTLGNALAVIALLCFVAAIIGMAISGSHRWVEPLEEAGWMFFTGCVLVLYLVVPSDGELDQKWVSAAWGLGALAIALLLASFIANLAAQQYHYWFEAIETAGLVAMVLTIIASIMARGGWGKSSA
jgi:predicted MFS family arabinose efflux permease